MRKRSLGMIGAVVLLAGGPAVAGLAPREYKNLERELLQMIDYDLFVTKEDFEMAKRFVLSLLGDPRFRLMAEPSDVEAALLWALLHDVGHYPLSHMFEDLAEEERRVGGGRTIPTDDDLFWAFVDPSSVDESFADYPERIAAGVTWSRIRSSSSS